MTKPLSKDLEELEARNPKVKRAADKLDAVTQELTHSRYDEAREQSVSLDEARAQLIKLGLARDELGVALRLVTKGRNEVRGQLAAAQAEICELRRVLQAIHGPALGTMNAIFSHPTSHINAALKQVGRALESPTVAQPLLAAIEGAFNQLRMAESRSWAAYEDLEKVIEALEPWVPK